MTDDIHFVARYQSTPIPPTPTAVEEVQSDKVPTTKYIYDGILYIERNGNIINVLGQPVR